MRATALVLRGKKFVEEMPREVPKPFTTPPGFKPPTLGEQWRYAALRHPYARYGAVGAVLLGALGYALATHERNHAGGGEREQRRPAARPPPR